MQDLTPVVLNIPRNQDDVYRALAFTAQSYTFSLGSQSQMDKGSGGPFEAEHDLQGVTFFDTQLQPGIAVRHIFHSGQFRSFLANRTHTLPNGEVSSARRGFWYQFLLDIKQGGANVTPRP